MSKTTTAPAESAESGPYHWERPGVPHRGWSNLDVEDMGEPSFQCEMCGYPEVRFVHTMQHPDHPKELRVGCVCAGHMEEDYEAAQRRERSARNTARRRANYMRRRAKWTSPGAWRWSQRGNLWRKVKGVVVAVFPNQDREDTWKGMIGEEFGTLTHPTRERAMLAIFDRLFPNP
jgi:hypothetical protein